ncbi:ABC transporter substrate-binding protein [Neolewinella agarilytica]|uniref:ABC transporter substrate-binding protein n=1 Tax=Neolewinella agarilytica TaxID=478744 RepID=UPI0023538CFD|nr:ABC transporter substrate-binding protein [Neolewinella agarilytica]
MFLRFFFCLLLAGGLFACKTDSAPTATDNDSDSPVISFKNTDNTARIALRVEPPGLNPVLSTQAASRYVGEMIFQTLNSMDPDNFEQVPLLASLPDITKEPGGGVSYSYLIDERATWPNGLPVTAADVIFSLKLVLNPLVASGAYRPYYDMVSSVVTSPNNERRFKVMCKRPYLIAQESLGSLVIYPEYAYDPDRLLRKIRLGDLTTDAGAERLAKNSEELKTFSEAFSDPDLANNPERIVGSGPYQLVSWEPGQQLTLDRREKYWGSKSRDNWLKAKPESIIFQIISDNGTMANAIRDEAVDVVVDMSVDQFKELRDDDYLNARYEFGTIQSLKYFGLLFNQQHPLFKDASTRRALTHLVDVDAIIDQLFPNGLANRVTGPVLPGKSYYNGDLPEIPYSPEKASELLKSAGWEDTNGDGTLDKEIDGSRQEFSFQFLIFPSPTSDAVGALVSEWMGEAGIEVEVVRQDFRALYGELNKGNFALAIIGQGFTPNPDEFTQVWASTSVPPNGTNRGGFASAEADKLINQIKGTLKESDRDPLYRRFQEILYENQPMIFLFSPADRVVVSKRFDFEPSSISPNVDFNALEKKE